MTTALYRRYRPETFGEVIGQEHVTAPLMQALRTGRVNHAYLFSGPRGCGKTTSARILARCLNCATGPTDTPCGVCPSCVELARGGPGSLDVVEIDAASHGGVDDARDLRERATFAPARDRFKIFILDEAHMVTPQGFNALLKIVEEPPEHVMFIFATTEPDKVIGTIRSRTHHYPFRLVPPDVLTRYLEALCAAEGVSVGAGVLPLVIRAGAGSVRDSLSVLDQLVAGADETGIDYERAVQLLGYTHSTLLDDIVEAVAAGDGASAFRVVERVISTGHEPRRFVEDLLERLRDLIVLAASGEAADAALRDVPADQLTRMRAQAAHLGAAELSRSADLVNAALGEMTGATSPRLHLELLVARLLLPAADDGLLGHGARLDRLERGAGPAAVRAGGSGERPAAVGTAVAPGPPVTPEPAVVPELSGRAAVRAAVDAATGRGAPRVEPQPAPEVVAPVAPVTPVRPAPVEAVSVAPAPVARPVEPAPVEPAPVEPAPVAPAPVARPVAPPAGSPAAAGPSAADLADAGPSAADLADAEPSAADRADAEPTEGDPAVARPVPAADEGAWPEVARPGSVSRPREGAAGPAGQATAAQPSTPPADADRRPPAPVHSLLASGTPNAAPATPSAAPPAAAHPDAVRPPRPAAATGPDVPAREAPSPSRAAPARTGASGTSGTGPSGGAGPETEVLRRRWPEVLETLSRLKKVTWAMVSQNAQVGELTSSTLTLLFPGPGLATAFRAGPHAEIVQRAVRETLGFDVRVEGRVGDGASAGAPGAAARPSGAEPARESRGPRDAPARRDRVVDRAAAEASWDAVEPPDDDIPEGPTVDQVPPDLEVPQARSSARAAGERAHAASVQRTVAAGPPVEDSPSPDDPDIATSNLTGPPLVAQLLGGTVIDEQVGDEA
ncbi:DNA polymerase III subunit gamma and tau [Cellulomonas aerilata]|uniref:DNA-directed DNA polymerase n=1 Tax=Cellulomonas aerilata TaxID=515326 RepID=A0A512D899_9CELL|nr:DNA polymerase III subunit gamma and tau [Cellulomonas aerilata]GEO32691.1 hypothetical protein CAE01nite_04160 [Cellulomonas aerilata]